MKIALIGPGIMPIPPNGWGAVEMLIWDYYTIFKKHNINIEIINTNNTDEIIKLVNNKYDIVHLHYDVYTPILEKINAKVKILSSHYPFINNPNRYSADGYDKILPFIMSSKDFYIFTSSQNDIRTFVRYGVDPQKLFLSKLGVKSESYEWYEQPQYDRTLCFSQIVDRKRQYLIQDIPNIDFMGRLDDSKFTNLENYKGEVDRDFLNKEISKYSNFILISSIENTTPLAVKEALIGGLGVVVSESVAVELDTSLDFITLIPESKVNDLDYVSLCIQKNKEISQKKRKEIRKYAIETFDLENILINSYLTKIKQLLT